MATANVAAMKDYILNAYPSMNWKKRVSEMSDSQIMAVYFSLLGRKKKEKETKKEEETYRQMTIFDYI